MKKSFDIVIVGAGPAGLSAALAAAESGQRIAIIDSNPQIGGQIWRASPHFTVPALALALYQQIASAPNIEVIAMAKVVAAPRTGQLLIERPDSSFLLEYQQLILCTGARELFLPFPGWTLPGVTGAGGLQALVKAGSQIKNQRIVIAGSGPLLLASAETAQKAGAQVLLIAEQASKSSVRHFGLKLWRWPAKVWQALSLPHQLYQPNQYVIEALGQQRLEAVRIQTAQGVVEMACDRLACGFGLVPNIQLGQLLGCQIEQQALSVDDFQLSTKAQIYAAGECTGFGGSELSLVEGRIAGYAATQQLQKAAGLFQKRQSYQYFAQLLQQHFKLRDELKQLARAETILCRCEDVSYAKVAARASWIDAKLHTRCGMGACQGSTCATTAAFLFDWTLAQSRPPLLPTRAESLIAMSDCSLSEESNTLEEVSY
ncbi:NADPH-dependent 2,4-dienoyl-CoA reductase/sulfur reductase-like enzyme [Acinetobacter calcoaceticus]|uniref:NADPH-dependent 2,4-dienoyl-CoA reductase/sulfur reductase-like enzyme n=1 Tax=Acinetobacter calcoaceticus TaxID=471 RepID=A0A4R1XNR7_ACICA|nr:NADPH-dependent 2,4-dienoyl-CoA reductase/sulfur reductase-like enzyme [Acinetobacter calcoaceticus]